MFSTKSIAKQALDLSPPFSVIKDVFGYKDESLGAPFSLRGRLSRLANGDAPCLWADMGFRPNPNGLSIPNDIRLHRANFDNFVASFGASEVVFLTTAAWLFDPVGAALLWPFYFWGYKDYFEKNATGFCTGYSGFCLEKYWGPEGAQTYHLIPPGTQPGDVPEWIRDRMTVIHGRLLSRQLITHCYDECCRGLDNVDAVFRLLMQEFHGGTSPRRAPVLFFLPSGDLGWGEFFDKLNHSHTVVPYKAVMAPDWQSCEEGKTIALVYIYDNNYPCVTPGGHNCKIEFYKKNGRMHFRYGGAASGISSENGFTLGTASMAKLAFDDVDLPFTGPGSLLAFLVELLLSPASVTIHDGEGCQMGGAQGLAKNPIPGAAVSPFRKNCFLLPANKDYRREIRPLPGANGTYSYLSTVPGGGHLLLKDIPVGARTLDVLHTTHDSSAFRFQTQGEAKPTTISLASVFENKLHLVCLENIPMDVGDEIQGQAEPASKTLTIGNPRLSKNVLTKRYTMNLIDGTIEKQLSDVVEFRAQTDVSFEMGSMTISTRQKSD